MKLISLRIFILSVLEEPYHALKAERHFTQFQLDKLERIRLYTIFIGQKVTLGMYVSCDLEGNALKDPELTMMQGDGQIYYGATDEEFEQYQQAKDRVLFKGWTYNHEDGSLTYTWTHEDGDVIEDRFYQGHIFSEGQTIEKIVDDEFPMELTETAVRMFNGK